MAVPNLTEKLENVRALCNRLTGKQETLLASLKELGYDSLQDAEKALKKLEKELAESEQQLEAKWDKFNEDYGSLLEAAKTA